MATNKRTYPNTYFTWYNDDNRIAILAQDTTTTSGERTKEKYDTFQGDGSSESGTITGFTDEGDTILAADADHGLVTGNSITIDSSANNFDDTYEITKVSKDTFRFTDASTPGGGETGTWTAASTNVLSGLRITYHAKYEEADATTDNLQSDLGLDSALHNAVVCYVKARLYEDDEDIEYANYYRQMYERKIKKFRSRRSAVRHLAVTKL